MIEQLKRQVERAVRPVRAGRVRKLQMREELLAHLTALYEEERQTADDAAALAAALTRFGDPAELTRELDRSVGTNERCTYYAESFGQLQERWLGPREGESFLRHAARCFAIILLYHLAGGLLLAILNGLGLPTRPDPTSYRLRVGLLIFGFSTLSSWFFLLAIYDVAPRAFGPNSRLPWPKLYFRSLLWAVPYIPLWWVVWGTATGDFQEASRQLPWTAAIAFSFFPLSLFGATFAGDAVSRRNEPYEAWAKIRIDD